jgi:diacylglycerol O-acyltransferase
MQRLSALDATFLNIESPSSPMHVGGILVFRAAPELKGRPGLAALHDTLERRMGLLPRCRQRLVDVPLGLGHPVWVDDPDFELDNHIHRHALPGPPSRERLLGLVARLHADPLPRDRPLWEMHLIESAGDGTAALYIKLHHAMVDGASAIELGLVLLDPDAAGTMIEEPAPLPPARPLPAPPDLLGVTAREAVQRARSTAGRVARMRWPRGIGADGLDLARASRDLLGLARPAPGGPLSTRVGRSRRIETVSLSLQRAKEIKNATGTTINDVVLATVGEGLFHFLNHRGAATPGLRYRVLVPVSLAAGRASGELGNRLTGMFVDLPVGPMAPARRLQAVARIMGAVKTRGQSAATGGFLELAALIPAPLHAMAGRLLSGQRLVNLVVSNVPGVQMPLYLGGARLLEVYPLLPLPANTGLVVCVLSYDGSLHVGIVADGEAISDAGVFTAGLRRGFRDLARATTGSPGAAGKVRVPA